MIVYLEMQNVKLGGDRNECDFIRCRRKKIAFK